MTDNDDTRKLLKDYAAPTVQGVASSIKRPTIQANNFEIKHVLIQMLQNSAQFSGLPNDDPNAHIEAFIEICDMVKYNGATDDAIKLRLFPFSLRDKVENWLSSLHAGSIKTWDDLAQKFLGKYFPPAKSAKMCNDISNFVQMDNESLYEAWERFKDLLRRCPHHGVPIWSQLMNFAQGKIVLALEGGYNLNSIADSALACVEVLLDTPSSGSSEDYPFESTWRVIKAVRQELSPYWPALAHELPAKLISQSVALAPNLMSSSDSEADEDNGVVSESTEEILQGVIQPLSKLKVDEDSEDKVATVSNTWRLELSKIDVWYASFGSNMWKSRFLCYVEGGQVEGMQKPCPGSADKTPPKDIVWKTYPYRLFFGRDFTLTWGSGGVAFLHPESKIEDKAYFCLYRITLEQFNDILRQENGSINNMASPLFDLTAVDSVTSKEPNSLEVLKGWYGNVIYLGKEQDIPILTMTCSHSDARRFKAGELPSLPPCEEYKTTLMKGLVDGRQLSEEEAIAYLQEASTKPL